MEASKKRADLPPIPAKRYFTIGEVSELCGVKPHVLRYWEQEFPQLKPVKRRGNRRYYQRQDVITIRQIRSLLYDEGFTIGGAVTGLAGTGLVLRLNGGNDLSIVGNGAFAFETALQNGARYDVTVRTQLFMRDHITDKPGSS